MRSFAKPSLGPCVALRRPEKGLGEHCGFPIPGEPALFARVRTQAPNLALLAALMTAPSRKPVRPAASSMNRPGQPCHHLEHSARRAGQFLLPVALIHLQSGDHFGNPENCLTFFQAAAIVTLLLNNLASVPEDTLCFASPRTGIGRARGASDSTLPPPRAERDERSRSWIIVEPTVAAPAGWLSSCCPASRVVGSRPQPARIPRVGP